MAMSETYELFRLGELDTISFTCPACSTEILFKLNTPTTFGVPCSCPTCRVSYVEIGQILAKYRDLFNATSKLTETIRLRVKLGAAAVIEAPAKAGEEEATK
jgi:hypothetical protein